MITGNVSEKNKYICYFDASHREYMATIAYIVKDSENKVLLQSSKVIKCKASHIAEARALTELLCHLSFESDMCLIPKNSDIVICGDCKSIIDFVKDRTTYTNCKHKITYNSLLYYYLKLKQDNNIVLKWITRAKNKEADAIARKLLKYLKF